MGFGPLLEDKLCLIFKLAPSVCRMTFPILASLLVRLVVLRSEERFSRNAETDLVCRLLLEKKKPINIGTSYYTALVPINTPAHRPDRTIPLVITDWCPAMD